MIISDKHRYVYIGIPRTGSKSMNHWLCEHFDGRNLGGHHDYDVPEDVSDYLIFTVVRNPYDREVSSHFAVTWGDATQRENEPPWEDDTEAVRNATTGPAKLRALLEPRAKWEQRPPPEQSPIPLEERIRAKTERNEARDLGTMTQKRFVDLARVNLVLYLERMPDCLRELPFVPPGNIPPFPHHPERGIRPPGDFFDFFRNTDEEKVVWAHASEDFEAFGYPRFRSGLPEDAPNALGIE